MLVALSKEKSWEFLAAMSQAWAWTQERPRFYIETGGNQTVEAYIEDAKAPEKKQIAVIDGGKIVSVVTVRLVSDDAFEVHVTSCKGISVQTVTDALKAVRDSLFQTMGANVILTSCPLYGKHEHKGSRQLAEACGMVATGVEWKSTFDESTIWREYALTRDQYHGKSETSTN